MVLVELVKFIMWGGGEEKVHFVCLIMTGNYPDYDNMIFSEVVEKVLVLTIKSCKSLA